MNSGIVHMLRKKLRGGGFEKLTVIERGRGVEDSLTQAINYYLGLNEDQIGNFGLTSRL